MRKERNFLNNYVYTSVFLGISFVFVFYMEFFKQLDFELFKNILVLYIVNFFIFYFAFDVAGYKFAKQSHMEGLIISKFKKGEAYYLDVEILQHYKNKHGLDTYSGRILAEVDNLLYDSLEEGGYASLIIKEHLYKEVVEIFVLGRVTRLTY